MVGDLFRKLSSGRGRRAKSPADGRPRSITPAQKIGYLSAQEVFRDLTEEDMDWLGRATTMVTCEKGHVIYRPGDSGEVLYLLKTGSVDLYRLSPEGKKFTIAHLGEQTFFGEMSILGQGMYESFAEASQPSVLCAMTRHDVEQLLLTKPIVALRLLQVIGQRVLEVEALLEDFAFRSVAERMASLLLRLSRQQGSATIEGLTHQELADMAGTFRETATQALNQLKGQGLIEIGRTRIAILDADGLAGVAQSQGHG